MAQEDFELTPVILQSDFNQFGRPDVTDSPGITRQEPLLRKQIATLEVLPLRLQIRGEDLVGELGFYIEGEVAVPEQYQDQIIFLLRFFRLINAPVERRLAV